jgi:hypothetical protein
MGRMKTRIADGLGLTRGNPLRPFVIGYLWFNLITSAAALVLFALDLDFVYVFLALMWPLGAPIVLTVIWFVNRPFARDLNELRQGNYIARWELTADELSRFEDAEWRRARRDAKIAPAFGLMLAVLLGAFTLAFTEDIAIAGLAAGIGLAIGLTVATTSYLFGKLRFHRRDTRAGDVRFSERGVLQPSGYLPYRGFNLTPIEILVEDGDPSMLRFRVGSVTENLTTREQEFRVPIPNGREAEAADLAARLTDSPALPSRRAAATSVATAPSTHRHREP